MVNRLFQLKSYGSYWLDAVDEHSLHSPFLFDLYTKVVRHRTAGHEPFEQLRSKLLQDDKPLVYTDFGSGSQSNGKRIRDIAHASMSPLKYSLLYQNLIGYFDYNSIVELGTSFGINSLYLGKKKNAHVTTFEGSKEIASIASLTLEFASVKNIQLIVGDISDTLPSYLAQIRKIDFVFIDANHRLEPTLDYFNLFLPKLHHKSLVIIDDIHYSPEMEAVWEKIRKHELVYTSVDLYRCGLLFFDPSLNKQHVILQF